MKEKEVVEENEEEEGISKFCDIYTSGQDKQGLGSSICGYS